MSQKEQATNGIQEVDGSIPFSSTNRIKHLRAFGQHRTARLSEKCPKLPRGLAAIALVLVERSVILGGTESLGGRRELAVTPQVDSLRSDFDVAPNEEQVTPLAVPGPPRA